MNLQASNHAGPSRQPYNPLSINRYSASRSNPPSSSSRASTPSIYGRSNTPNIFARSSTPTLHGNGNENRRGSTPSLNRRSSTPMLYPNGARFRSASVLSTTQKEDEEFRKKRSNSIQKLKSTWDLLKEKYGSISLEDDDEIDLRTGEITRDRGRLRQSEGRDFGEASNIEDEEGEEEEENNCGGSSIFGGSERFDLFDSDEDEIGAWDERSGLDPQLSDPPFLDEDNNSNLGGLSRTNSWVTEEDQDDLREFLRLEAERNKLLGGQPINEQEFSPEPNLMDDEERERLLSPRFRGTRILPARLEDLFLSDDSAEEQEESEDELQVIGRDRDGTVTKRTPAPVLQLQRQQTASSPPIPRRRKILEVVIPLRTRRASLPATVSSKAPQPAEQPFREQVRPSASAPSLADLFNTPPPEDFQLPPLSPFSSRHSSPADQIRVCQSSNPEPLVQDPRSPSPPPRQQTFDTGPCLNAHRIPSPPPRVLSRPSAISSLQPAAENARLVESNSSKKGKERMAGERSEIENETTEQTTSTSESPYYSRLWKNRNGIIKICKRCKRAGGVRAEKAPWCKGRKGSSQCTFEHSDPQSNAGHTIDLSNNQIISPMQESPDHMNAESVSSETEEENTAAETGVIISKESQNQYHLPGVRRCPICREAGGQRAARANICQGRVSFRRCRWYRAESVRAPDDAGESTTEESPIKSRHRHSSIMRHIVPPPIDMSDKQISTIYRSNGYYDPNHIMQLSDNEESELLRSLTPGMRLMSDVPDEPPERPQDLDNNIYCRGLTFRKKGRARRCGLCTEAGGERAQRAWWCKGRSWAKFCHFAKDGVESSPGGQPADSSFTSTTTITNGTLPRTPEVVLRSNSTSRAKRKRNTSIIHTLIHSTSPSYVVPQSQTSHMPSPPPTSSVEPISPVYGSSIAAIRQADVRSASEFSIPPSSPPIFTPSNRPVHPTPSPSLSASLAEDSPTVIRNAKSLLMPRGTTIGFRPTPPPSIDGARNSSLLSDHIPLTLPRKGILRRPSESSCPSSNGSGSGSVKRTRFSLQPRSPVRDESSDPLYQEQYDVPTSEDEGGYHNYQGESSPILARGFSSSSPALQYNHRYSSSSASPLRNEWTVRAKDIGMNLGPEHTGSLPRGMIRALAASLSNSDSDIICEPTLASVNKNFILPTPPPSFGSTSSSASIIRNTIRDGSSPAASSGTSYRKSSNAGLMLPPPVPLRKSTPTSSSVLTPSISIVNAASTALPKSSTPTPTRTEKNATVSHASSAHKSISKNTSKAEERHPVSAAAHEGITPRSSVTDASSNISVAIVSTPPTKVTPQAISRIKVRPKSLPRATSRSMSISIQPVTPLSHKKLPMREISTTPRKKSRVERELARKAKELGDDAGLEWGLDEDTQDGGRMWREGSVVMLHSEL